MKNVSFGAVMSEDGVCISHEHQAGNMDKYQDIIKKK